MILIRNRATNNDIAFYWFNLTHKAFKTLEIST